MLSFESWNAWIEHWYQYLLDTNEEFALQLLQKARQGVLVGSVISVMAEADPLVKESFLEQQAVSTLGDWEHAKNMWIKWLTMWTRWMSVHDPESLLRASAFCKDNRDLKNRVKSVVLQRPDTLASARQMDQEVGPSVVSVLFAHPNTDGLPARS